MYATLPPMRLLGGAALCALALAGCGGDSGPGPAPAARPQPMDLTIAHINDSHSNLDSSTRTLSLLQPNGVRTDVEVDAGGFPRVTAAIKAIRASNDNVIALHAGDDVVAPALHALGDDAKAVILHRRGTADASEETLLDALTELDDGDAVGGRRDLDGNFADCGPWDGDTTTHIVR